MRSKQISFSGVCGHFRISAVRFAAAIMLCAAASPTAHGSDGGFAVSETVSTGSSVSSLARASELLSGPTPSASSGAGSYDVINFKNANEAGRMHFPGALPFPVAEPHNNHNFAMHITGEVEIPEAGAWTFGVKSNGGFNLQIGDQTMHRNASSGGSTRVVPMEFAAAGTYAIDVTYYEHAERATLELFAAEGQFHRYGTRRADWNLVGDTAEGGLALATDLPTLFPSVEGDPSADPVGVLPNDIPSVGSDSAVPEPGALTVAMAAAPWMLGRRWRRRKIGTRVSVDAVE